MYVPLIVLGEMVSKPRRSAAFTASGTLRSFSSFFFPMFFGSFLTRSNSSLPVGLPMSERAWSRPSASSSRRHIGL